MEKKEAQNDDVIYEKPYHQSEATSRWETSYLCSSTFAHFSVTPSCFYGCWMIFKVFLFLIRVKVGKYWLWLKKQTVSWGEKETSLKQKPADFFLVGAGL